MNNTSAIFKPFTYALQVSNSLLICLMFLNGCASVPQLSEESLRSIALTKVAIIQNPNSPTISFDTYAKGRWAGSGKGILTGLGTLVFAPIVGATSGTLAGPFGTLAGAAGGAAVGAVYFVASPIVGAVKAIPANEAEKIDQTIPRMIVELKVQENFARYLDDGAQTVSADYRLKPISPNEFAEETASNYANFKQQGFDAVLEVAIDKIGFVGGKGSQPEIALFLNGNYRLFDLINNRVIYAENLVYQSPEHTIEEWTANDAKLIKSEFDKGYFKFADETFERSFTLFDEATNSWDRNSYCLLKPEYPPFEISLFTNSPKLHQVDSLQPTLRWQAFPRASDPVDLPYKINKVTYDLQIWSVMGNTRGELVYAKNGLAAPLHKLEKALKSDSNYYWTVRASFQLDQQRRVTQWSFSRVPEFTSCSIKEIPNNDYFQFITP